MKLKYLLITLLLTAIFTGCRNYDNYDPIFYVGCHLKYEMQSSGNSYLKEHQKNIKDIKMHLLAPSSELHNKLEYDLRSDALVVSISPSHRKTHETDFEEDYIFEIVFPESMQNRKDVIKVQYRNNKHARSFTCYVNGTEYKPLENSGTHRAVVKIQVP